MVALTLHGQVEPATAFEPRRCHGPAGFRHRTRSSPPLQLRAQPAHLSPSRPSLRSSPTRRVAQAPQLLDAVADAVACSLPASPALRRHRVPCAQQPVHLHPLRSRHRLHTDARPPQPGPLLSATQCARAHDLRLASELQASPPPVGQRASSPAGGTRSRHPFPEKAAMGLPRRTRSPPPLQLHPVPSCLAAGHPAAATSRAVTRPRWP